MMEGEIIPVSDDKSIELMIGSAVSANELMSYINSYMKTITAELAPDSNGTGFFGTLDTVELVAS